MTTVMRDLLFLSAMLGVLFGASLLPREATDRSLAMTDVTAGGTSLKLGLGKAPSLTAGELRRRLAAVDDTMLVLLPGQEGGFSGLQDLEPMAVVLHVNGDPLFGPHDVPAPGQRPDAVAVVLRAVSSR